MRTYPLPTIGDDDALMRVLATGICGSDVAAYAVAAPFYDLPCVLGHEVVGEIVEIGARAAARWHVGVGDRVVLEEYMPCGLCEACLAGAYQMCDDSRYGGRAVGEEPVLWGGYADYMYLSPRALVHKVPQGLEPELAQFYIPVSNGMYWAQEIGGVHSGSRVVVIGPGTHGLGCVIGAREAGATDIVLVGRERDTARLEAGRALGATQILQLTGAPDEDPVALLGGPRGDVVINTASSAAALPLALSLARPLATIVQAGAPTTAERAGIDPTEIVQKMLVIRGVRGRPGRCIPPALELIASGKYPLRQLWTHTYEIAATGEALASIYDDPTVIRAVMLPYLDPRA